MPHDIDDVTYRFLRRFGLHIVDPGTYHYAVVRLDIGMQRLWHALRAPALVVLRKVSR